jgi:hypothetical protein
MRLFGAISHSSRRMKLRLSSMLANSRKRRRRTGVFHPSRRTEKDWEVRARGVEKDLLEVEAVLRDPRAMDKATVSPTGKDWARRAAAVETMEKVDQTSVTAPRDPRVMAVEAMEKVDQTSVMAPRDPRAEAVEAMERVAWAARKEESVARRAHRQAILGLSCIASGLVSIGISKPMLSHVETF